MNTNPHKLGPPTWLPNDLFPYESRFTEIHGHSIHYIDEGVGPTLLMLHGNPTWSFLYRDVIRGLQSRFRCIALDYPGFGLSRAANGYDFRPVSHARVVEGFLNHRALHDVTIMVQDWGGPIGLWVVGRQPERFRALVIGNTWAWPIDGEPHFERFSKFMGGWFGSFMIRHLNAFVNVMMPFGVKRKRLIRKVKIAYRGPFYSKDSRKPTHIFPREIRHSSAFLAEVEARLVRIKSLPTLIVWGDKDFAFRSQERERFERLFPHHRTEILRGAGHYLQEDAADEIAQAILAWWDEDVTGASNFPTIADNAQARAPSTNSRDPS